MWIKLLIILLTAEFSSAQSNVFNTSGIDFYYGSTLNDFLHYHISEVSTILFHPAYDHNKKTIFYIYGFREYRTINTVKKIISAYQHRGDHNILLLDWEQIANGNYILNAFPNTFEFGEILAEVLIKMTFDGLNLRNLHVVSHSLGSQLAGSLGRNIIKKTSGQLRLKRITALDPAFPLFYPPLFGQHLNANDAEMVDVIHTDGWIYGAPFSTGTVDFWPNGGKVLYQPGCTRNFQILSDGDLCPHWRSVRFYAESVINKYEPVFQARKCDSWNNFKKGYCKSNNDFVSMGIDTPSYARGDYYLQTNNVNPF
ncbi:hypothetical protein PVAND_013971 [Polypedilum vanderplanki]|uniref:Lipase domain-containing protein n=1 Tax=Polypedilum vanderplanki TaxID=319348 RepID=A0A9J6CRU6_POLVA|nr:hypothetical protein PVAND_013971 [Polypedilum vanderplanki]